MFFADSHTHSICSPDSTAPMVDMAKRAVQYGLTALTLTDHCDLLNYEGGQRELEYDWAPVDRERKAMLDAFGTQIDLPMGIELGMGHIAPDATRKILSQPGLDFVIGAVHNNSEDTGGVDFCLGDYSTLDNCYKALDNYFPSMIEMAGAGFYDVVAHIIYPLRYMAGDYPTPSLDRYQDHIHEILRLAIESGKGIEINTWKGQTLEEWLPILKMYKEMHGEIITVGSDAHDPTPIGRGIRQVYQMMQDVGFRYVALYHDRKPDMIRLK